MARRGTSVSNADHRLERLGGRTSILARQRADHARLNRLMDQAQEVILLADSSKFGQQALVKLCEMNDVDIVVSDAELSKDHRKQIEAAGCQLIIA